MQKFYIEKYKFPKNLKAYLENQNFSIKSKTYGKSKASQKILPKTFYNFLPKTQINRNQPQKPVERVAFNLLLRILQILVHKIRSIRLESLNIMFELSVLVNSKRFVL